MDLQALQQECLACRRCGLCETRTNVVFGQGVPTAILMDTLKGKGVSFMEDQAGWHGKAPSDEELEKALAELDAAKAELEAKCNG